MFNTIRESARITTGFYDVIGEATENTPDEVKNLFLDDPRAALVGAEDDPEIAKFVDSIPTDDPDANDATEKDVKDLVESMDYFFESYDSESDSAIYDRITGEGCSKEGCAKEADELDEPDDLMDEGCAREGCRKEAYDSESDPFITDRITGEGCSKEGCAKEADELDEPDDLTDEYSEDLTESLMLNEEAAEIYAKIKPMAKKTNEKFKRAKTLRKEGRAREARKLFKECEKEYASYEKMCEKIPADSTVRKMGRAALGGAAFGTIGGPAVGVIGGAIYGARNSRDEVMRQYTTRKNTCRKMAEELKYLAEAYDSESDSAIYDRITGEGCCKEFDELDEPDDLMDEGCAREGCRKEACSTESDEFDDPDDYYDDEDDDELDDDDELVDDDDDEFDEYDD